MSDLTITHEQVVNSAFIYAGNTVVFVSNQVSSLDVYDNVTIADRDKPLSTYTVTQKNKVSLGHFEIYAQKLTS